MRSSVFVEDEQHPFGRVDPLSFSERVRRLEDRRAEPREIRHIPTKLNCLYHVYAARENDLWLRNVRQLLKRSAIFSGRRVVAIAVDAETVAYERVVEAFAGSGFEPIRIMNCPQLREVASFRSLLESVASTSPDEATFYAHTKANSTDSGTAGAIRWAHLMYDKLLTDEAVSFLDRFAAVGTHKMLWGHDEVPPYPTRLRHGRYMFAGTFFWFRHDQVFTHPDWRCVPHDRYGAEAWLSGILDRDDCHSVWQPEGFDQYPTSNPYDPRLYPEHYDDF